MEHEKQVSYLRGQAAALNNKGILLSRLIEPAHGEYSARSPFTFQDRDQRRSLMPLNSGAGSAAASASTHFEKITDYYLRSLSIFETIGENEKVAMILTNLGTAYATNGSLAEAISWWEKSLAMQELIGDNAGLVVSLSNIGAAQRELGNVALSRESLNRALSLARSTKTHLLACIPLVEFGLLWTFETLQADTAARSRYNALARQCYIEAIELATDSSMRNNVMEWESLLSELPA